MRVKRIVFINRAPLGDLDLDLVNKNVISFTGINGAGKTTVISYIVDALHEIAKKSFYNEFKVEKEGKYYRISSEIYNVSWERCSLVYIDFDFHGKEIQYIDLLGSIGEIEYNKMMASVWKNIEKTKWPIKFKDIENSFRNGARWAKYVKIDENDARKAFLSNVLTYFPSYRYEQPGYLNDVFHMKLSYKKTSDLNGYLINPIEVTSDLPGIANWMMDVVLDSQLYNDSSLLMKLQNIMSIVFRSKLHRPVRVGIGRRNMGGARVQVVDAQNAEMIYPTIFDISSGESALLCLFVELFKQADNIGKGIDEVEGIVLVDEIDKHLHIFLQKDVVPVLMEMFPKVQFIITTHSTFVNIGVMDRFAERCGIFDLDNGGIEGTATENEVFREAYNAMIFEKNRQVLFLNELTERIKEITKPVVYVEGRTDEKYFNKALEVFGYRECDIDIKWIGHIDENGKEAFSGASSLNSALQFLKGKRTARLLFFLFDCDTKKQEFDDENIVVMTMPYFKEHNRMNKGIENALELGDEVDIEKFYEEHTQYGDYGKKVVTNEFKKMKMCEYICDLDEDKQRRIFGNLKPIIDRIMVRCKNAIKGE